MKHFARAALIAATLTAAPAAAKDTVTFAYLADPSHEAVMWALQNGKVTSDTIAVEADALQIPALIQGTATRAYDVVQTAGMAIPRLRNRGMDIRIIGVALRYHAHGEGADIWVPADSPIKSAEDLKGKRLATYSLGSSGVTLARVALADTHGFNVDLEGGDVEFVEMPAPAMPAALAAGRVDAATLIHAQAFEAQETGAFRSIVSSAVDNYKAFGVRMVSAVLAGYGDRLDAEPEKYQEFLRLLSASAQYAADNPDEVFAAVAAENDMPQAFFTRWFAEFSEFPVFISADDRTAIETLWLQAERLGLLSDLPPVNETVWSETVTADAAQ